MNPTLGEKLKYFRERTKISQLDLEIAINASQGSISRIENNKINPTKETVMQIADSLLLNDYEISYLIGHTQNPANQEEIKQAKNETNKYFSKKTTLAYMTDDRSRLIDMSQGFKLLADIDEKKWNQLQNQPFPIILLRDEFGLKRFLDKEKLNKVLIDSLARTYTEMGFMKGDYWNKIVIKELQNYPMLLNKWKEFDKFGKISEVRTMEDRTVYFNYHGIKFSMKYHAEVLPKYQRFMVLDYNPTNFLLKLLKTIDF